MKRTILLLLLCACLARCYEINWKKAPKVQRGVRLVKLELEQPRLIKVYIMRIDLSMPGLKFMGTPPAPDFEQPMPDWPKKKPNDPPKVIHTHRLETTKFMEQARLPKKEGGLGRNMIAAFNTTPWTPWPVPHDWKYAQLCGTNITNGKIISNGDGFPAHFIIHKNNKMEIIPNLDNYKLRKQEYLDDIAVACCGFGILCLKGKPVDMPGEYEKVLMPRMSVGYDKEQRYLFVVAADGRKNDWSLGMTGMELAQVFLDAGAYEAINFDGGGSATMCYWDSEEEKVVHVNHADGGPKSNYARPCAYNIGVYLPKEKDKKKAKAKETEKDEDNK
ncbi:MAG: phosphodiester glycosidase family protein [Victivallales bacterium]|nr:phosphodiester glycosidase family protein [Victivallales bacterium]